MIKHIGGQAIYQMAVVFTFVFAGEHFLFDIIGQRQLQPGKNTIVPGREASGYSRDLYNGSYSVHYTYNFNVFVILQVFNFLNCRILDDSFNIFKGFFRSYYFGSILLIIFVLQIIFLTFTGPAVRVVMWVSL